MVGNPGTQGSTDLDCFHVFYYSQTLISSGTATYGDHCPYCGAEYRYLGDSSYDRGTRIEHFHGNAKEEDGKKKVTNNYVAPTMRESLCEEHKIVAVTKPPVVFTFNRHVGDNNRKSFNIGAKNYKKCFTHK